MTEISRRALFWAPRIISILFISFVSMFALDVFSEGRGFWQTVVALIMHLIPTFALIGALILAWRWEWVGAALFLVFAVFFTVIVRGTWWVKGIFAVPCFATAWLFLANWTALRNRVH